MRCKAIEQLESRLLLSVAPSSLLHHASPHHPSVLLLNQRKSHGHPHGHPHPGGPPPPDTGPTAAIQAANVTSPTAAATVTVTYSGNVAVAPSSIAVGNISVSGPDGIVQVSSAQVGADSGASLVATYAIAAPQGGWASSDNGTYNVALNANQVFDAQSVAANSATGAFTVNVPSYTTTTGPTDPTFAGGNTVNAGFVTEAILSESNGKVLVVGYQGDPSKGQEQGVIEQLRSNGAPATGFGNNGMIVTPVGQAYYAAAMPDPKHFIVAGTSAGNFVLREYNANGTPVNSFGTNGTVITDFGTATDAARALTIGAGGTIVAGGDSGGNFAFARYLPTGQLDPNFAQAGRQLFSLGGGNNGLGAIAIQSDGRIVATGSEGSKVIAVRLTSSGEADGTFGNGGVSVVNLLTAQTDLGEADHTEGLALMPDGGILVANRTQSGHFGLVRLNIDGSIAGNFGAGGLATADFGGDDDADSIIVQSTGPVIVIGTSLKSGTAQTALAAFDPSGATINSFANNGLLTLPSGIPGSVAAQQTSGKMTTKALHVGDIILRAFGTLTADGRVIIGTTNQAVAATTSSTLRRLIVPGALLGGPSTGTLLGSFGFVDGRIKKLTVTIHGAPVTLSLIGGTATASQDGSALDLTVDDAGRGVALAVNSGGTEVTLGNVTVSGTVRAMSAPNCDLSGTLHVTGAIGRLLLHNMTGSVYSGASIAGILANNLSGTVFAVEAIGRVKAADLTGTIASGSGVIGGIFAASMENAMVLSGANFGDDGHLGGVDPDTFGPGSIGSIRVTGPITSSFIGAGVSPVDSVFGNSDDRAAGTGPSVIRSIVAASADSATHFEATAFSRVVIGQTIDPNGDPRFRILSQ
jgi:uncharacterized delta-60 repeat protein